MSADAQAVLLELPATLWPALLQAVRKAADRLGRNQLPVGLQPYAGFAPARLGQGRAKPAVIAALAGDARVREAMGQALGDDVWREAASAPPAELVERFGEATAVAGLMSRERWSDASEIAARVRAQEQQQPRSAQPAPAARAAGEESKAAVARLRRERDGAQRRAEAAEQRVAALQQDLRTLRDRVAAAEAERAVAERRYDEERTRSRDRLARLQRRISDAESRSRVDAARLAAVAGDLERMAGELRHEPGPEPPGPTGAPNVPRPTSVPRSVRSATPGRPCVLPPGITDAQPEAVNALLSVAGIEVIVDGYNVSKDLRGVPTAGLPEQRAWLERLLAGVAAGREVRMTVVFDGDGERTTAAAPSRIVRTVFTSHDEIADERIVAIVSSLASKAPALVVTSDREVATACQDLRVNVVASGVFLRAVA